MKKLSFCLAFMLISLSLSFAQAKWLSFKSHVAVNDFIETDQELLLGTSNGLVKLNKYNFDKTYLTTQNSNLPSSHIQAITIDEQGNSWIGTYDGILALVGNNEFTEITAIPSSLWGENHRLLSFEIDQEGVKWIGITGGLLRYDGVEWILYNQSTITNNSISLSDTWAIDIDEQNNLIVSSFQNFHFDGTNWTNLSQGTSFFTYESSDLYRDQANNLWWTNFMNIIGRYTDGVWTEYNISNAAQWYPEAPSFLKGITEKPDGAIIAYSDTEVYQLIDEVWVLQNYSQMTEANASVDFLYFDQDGHSWLGAGIYLSKKAPDTFSEINIGLYPLRSNTITHFAEATDGSTYIVNKQNHIAVYKSGEWSEINTDPIRAISPSLFIFDIAVGPSNQIYLSSHKGIFEYNAGEWTRYHQENNNAPFLSVNRLAMDQTGKLWVTAWSGGLYSLEDGIWNHYDASNSPIPENESFHDINVDQNNVVWTYSANDQLYRIDQDDWTSIDISQINIQTAFSGNFHIDSNNHIWFSSWNDGVFQYDGNDWKHYHNSNTGLQSDQVYGISSDQEGIVYFGTRLGMTTFDGSSWKNYNHTNSLLYDKPVNKIFVGSNGTCWMASSYYGVFAFNLSGFTTSSFSPDQTQGHHLEIFPNPARDLLNLEYSLQQNSPVQLHIIDTHGSLLFQDNLGQQVKGQHRVQLNLQTLAKGIYFIKIQSQDNSSIQKLILH